jgi:serine protease Do
LKTRIWQWFLFGFAFGAMVVGLVWIGISIERNHWETGLTAVETNQPVDLMPDSLANELGTTVTMPEIHAIGRRTEITEAIRNASPAVVGITVTKERTVRRRTPFSDDPFFRQFFSFFPDNTYQENVENFGSGFILAPDGYIVTNEHVVNEADSIVVTLTDGRRFNARVLGTDYDTDLALLKVEARDLPWLRISDQDELIVGEWVISIGNPFGLVQINDQPSVSVGVISAYGRDFRRQEDGRAYLDMIQTDAAINPGNSGGPLINAMGEVVGVNTFIFTAGDGTTGSIGIGFAIPTGTVLTVVDNLRVRAEINDKVWTGMTVNNLSRSIAISLGYPSLQGVLITQLVQDGPAQTAGMMRGDILMAVNGVAVTSIRSLSQYFDNHDLRVGDQLDLQIFRNRDSMMLHMQLVEAPTHD